MYRDGFLATYVYPYIFLIVVTALSVFVLMLILRLIFNFNEPNPFSAVGRFAFKIKKLTDRFVYPAAGFLAGFRINTKYAPLLTIFISAVLAYFSLSIIGNAFFIVDGLVLAGEAGNIKAIIGFILYAALSAYILFILIRFVAMWFTARSNKFLRFVYKVTEPVLAPARRLIPPVKMFDLSAMIVLILIMLLQMIVLGVFVNS